MRSAIVPILFCLILFWSNHHPTASADTANQPTNAAKPTPLILEKNEGERRVWRVVEGFVGPPMEGFVLDCGLRIAGLEWRRDSRDRQHH